jgi:ketosteroid isomerase-like protein
MQPSRHDTTPDAPLVADLAALNAQHIAHFAASDFDALMGTYTEDARVLVAHQPPLVGRVAIRHAYAQMRPFIAAIELQTEAVQVYAGATVEAGRYRHLNAQRRLVDEGHNLVVWQWRQSRWQIHHDVLCTGRPLP